MSESDNWPMVRLGDVVEAKYGKALQQAKRHGGGVPVYGSNGIVGWHDTAITTGPTVIIGRKGSSGAVNFSKSSCWPIDTTYFIDNPGPFKIEFLDFLLRSLGLPELDRSTAIPGLNREQLYDIEVPIPSLEQQAAIAETIYRISAKREDVANRLSKARRAIERFHQSILAAACSGRLTAEWREDHPTTLLDLRHRQGKRPKQLRDLENYDLEEIPDTWKWVQVEDLLPQGGIFDGPFGSHLKSSDYTDSGARVVRLENIGHLKFIEAKRTYVSPAKFQLLAKHAVWPGDIVFSSFVEERVRVCVLPDTLDAETIAKADCFTLRPLPVIDRHYLTLQLASQTSYRNLAGDIHGATRPRVNTTQVRSLPIPLCAPEEQQEIVRRFSSLMEAADRLQSRVEAAMRRVERSSQAILTKAFRGELTLGSSSKSPGE